jgi:flagellar biosynthesis/type III secretory pathway protein FliH
MGLYEAVLDDVKRQGIQEGRQEGLIEGVEQGVELEKRNFTLKLWDLQEFPLEKIELLVDLNKEKILEIISEHLQNEGLAEEEAKIRLENYKQ